MASIICEVPAAHVALLWPQIEPHIARALKRDPTGGYWPQDIRSVLEQEQAQLWISWNEAERRAEAAMVTELLDCPRTRMGRVWLIGGSNMKAWVREFEERTDAWARRAGASCMIAGGREGWARVSSYRRSGGSFYKPL